MKLTLLLALAAAACNSAELLRALRPGTALATALALRSRLDGRVQPWRRRLFSMPALRTVLVLRLGAALAALGCLLLGPGLAAAVPCLALLCAATLLAAFIKFLGGDGADQISLLTLLALTAGAAFRATPGVLVASLLFIAMQTTLAYFIAGVAKAVSPVWRRSNVIGDILNTAGYGHSRAARLLLAHPGLGRALGLFTITWETASPLALLLPLPYLWLFLGLTLCFHAGCAVLMGLNDFLLAFPATYPAVVFAALFLQSHL